MKSKLTQPKAIQLKQANRISTNAAGVRKLSGAPARYQPLPLPRVLQTKQTNQRPEAPRRANALPVAPPPYQPQPTPRVLQRRTSGPARLPAPLTPKPELPQSLAQPVKSAVSRQSISPDWIVQVKNPSASRGGLVIQRAAARRQPSGSDEAAHNWDNVINQYTDGVAGVIDTAFIQAGYGAPAARRKAILKALRATGWAKSKIAHSLGGEGSGMRGGTLEKINKCKDALLKWAKSNPAAVPSAPVFGSSSRKEKKEDSDDYDRESMNILLFAKWAKDNDKSALEALRKAASRGNELAQQKLEEVMAHLQPAAAAAAVPVVVVPPLIPPQGQGDGVQNSDGGES